MTETENQHHLITLMEKRTAQRIRTMNWNELLGFVKRRYPEAYIAPLDEMAFFQIGNQESVFCFEGFIDDGKLEKSCSYEPFFTEEETQKHFAPLKLCYGTKRLMNELIDQFVWRQVSYCDSKQKMYRQALERQKIMQMKHRKYYLLRAMKNMSYWKFNEWPHNLGIIGDNSSWLRVIDLVKLYKQTNWADYIFVYSRW